MPVFETGAFNHSATRPGPLMAPADGRQSTQRPRRNVNQPHPPYQRVRFIPLAGRDTGGSNRAEFRMKISSEAT